MTVGGRSEAGRWGRVGRRRSAMAAGLVAVTLLTGCSIADRAPRTSPIPTHAAGSDTADRAEVTYLPECGPDSLVKRPSSYVLACGDGGELLEDLTWRAWGEESATAGGNMVTNDCNPNCAEGSDISNPVKVVADQLSVGEGTSVYRRLTVTLDTPGGGGVQTVLHLPESGGGPSGDGPTELPTMSDG